MSAHIYMFHTVITRKNHNYLSTKN